MTFCFTSYDLSCIVSSHCDILTDWVSLLEDVCELRCSSPCVEPPLLQRSVNRSVQPPLPRSHGWWLPVYTLHAHPARYKYLFIPGKVSFLKVQKSFHKKSGLWTKDSPPPPLHFCTPKWVFFKGKITSGVFFWNENIFSLWSSLTSPHPQFFLLQKPHEIGPHIKSGLRIEKRKRKRTNIIMKWLVISDIWLTSRWWKWLPRNWVCPIFTA